MWRLISTVQFNNLQRKLVAQEQEIMSLRAEVKQISGYLVSDVDRAQRYEYFFDRLHELIVHYEERKKKKK